jgi:uncharacterized protein YkwD
MAQKTVFILLFSILLTACISVSENSESAATQADFVTATLAATKTALPPSFTAVPSETATLAMTVPANCSRAAILLRDVTIQDDTRVNAGEEITKTWEFQNTGTCPWVGYAIKFSAGNPMGAPLSTPIADTPPGGKVQVSVELTVPTADGRYQADFILLDSTGEIVPIGAQTTFWVRFVVGAYVTSPTTSTIYPTLPGNCVHSLNANYVNEVVSLINAARADAGLPALTFNTQLAAFAQSHAEDMAFNNFLSHDGSNATFAERMMAFGIFGEILAISTPQNAMEQWRRDEHWDFVLTNGTQIGVGYAYNSCSDYGGYFTVDFQ